MATIFHLGGYGSGKSYGALHDGIFDELINGKRAIVTNLALLQTPKVNGKTVDTKSGVGALNQLIQRRYKNLDARVLQRVRILTEDEVPHFFCHRVTRGGWHYDIPVPTPDEERRGKRPDFSLIRDDGCVFVIDEFHDYFNARLWAEVGRSVGWYKNQQRKICDDIHACTPQIDEVDKQIRTIGHEYRTYVNLGQRKVRGIVLPQTFLCTVYSSLDAVKRKSSPLNKFPFTMDYELANCYDTAKGVRGLQGGSADIGKRPKGIHWSIPVGIFFLVIFLIIFAAFRVRSHMRQNPKHTVQVSQTSTSVVPQAVPSADLAFPRSSAASRVQVPAGHSDETDLYCVGWSYDGKNGTCVMSDGTEYTSQDHEIDWIQKKRISIHGKVFAIKPSADISYANFSAPPQSQSSFTSAPHFDENVPASSVQVFTIPNRTPLDMVNHNYNLPSPSASSSTQPLLSAPVQSQ